MAEERDRHTDKVGMAHSQLTHADMLCCVKASVGHHCMVRRRLPSAASYVGCEVLTCNQYRR